MTYLIVSKIRSIITYFNFELFPGICFSNYSSGLETSNKQGPFCDGSFSYGIFNIPGKYCGDGGICGISCESKLICVGVIKRRVH